MLLRTQLLIISEIWNHVSNGFNRFTRRVSPADLKTTERAPITVLMRIEVTGTTVMAEEVTILITIARIIIIIITAVIIIKVIIWRITTVRITVVIMTKITLMAVAIIIIIVTNVTTITTGIPEILQQEMADPIATDTAENIFDLITIWRGTVEIITVRRMTTGTAERMMATEIGKTIQLTEDRMADHEGEDGKPILTLSPEHLRRNHPK